MLMSLLLATIAARRYGATIWRAMALRYYVVERQSRCRCYLMLFLLLMLMLFASAIDIEVTRVTADIFTYAAADYVVGERGMPRYG